MTNKILYLITMLCLFGIVVYACLLGTMLNDKIITDRIITPAELQQQLVDMGYVIEVDGIIGVETITAWDEAVTNQIISECNQK